MREFGNLQILGAAITTIGLMFFIMNGLSLLNFLPMVGASLSSAVICLLMATNGSMIMLYGVVLRQGSAAPVGLLN
ncbi:MAG TPA: hypothetical protein VLT35_03770 [Methanocella sp.]|nr:hypothetical protein [Methanocella sp.]